MIVVVLVQRNLVVFVVVVVVVDIAVAIFGIVVVIVDVAVVDPEKYIKCSVKIG